ncbi:hypothetical protein D3C78_1741940 [compost metagenome]
MPKRWAAKAPSKQVISIIRITPLIVSVPKSPSFMPVIATARVAAAWETVRPNMVQRSAAE